MAAATMAPSSSHRALAVLLLAAALACHFGVVSAVKPMCHCPGGRCRGLGVNYGTVADDLPSAARSVQLLRAAGAGAVKIYDANPAILRALAGTGLPVAIMVPNQAIPSLASSRAAADAWVAANLAPHVPATRVMYLLVGNEVLSDRAAAGSTWRAIVPAMANLHGAIRARGIRKVKLSTTLAMDALSASYPPSAGAFRGDVAGDVIRPLLRFLNASRSFYFVDAYPYFAWAGNRGDISLDYALFQGKPSSHYVDPGTGLTYTNLLDQMLDAVVAAMGKLGYGNVKLAVAETGWPNAGGAGANVRNAATYNRNLAARMSKNPGTPARPRAKMPVFLFSLYDEDKKPGADTERHWGLYYPNQTSVYEIDLTGRRPSRSYPPLPPADDDTDDSSSAWCVLAGGGKAADQKEVQAALDYACQQGSGTCAAIQPGGACYEPSTLDAHASYAFNSYWQKFRNSGGTCFFNGLAETTTKDPSHGSCKFTSSED